MTAIFNQMKYDYRTFQIHRNIAVVHTLAVLYCLIYRHPLFLNSFVAWVIVLLVVFLIVSVHVIGNPPAAYFPSISVCSTGARLLAFLLLVWLTNFEGSKEDNMSQSIWSIYFIINRCASSVGYLWNKPYLPSAPHLRCTNLLAVLVFQGP